MSLAIIPARGGSKRLPGKNIRLFHGKPIIGYVIEAALESGCFSEVMVSTDSAEIADVAKQFGAQVPFIRSDDNANDHAGVAAVIREVLQVYAQQGRHFDLACCLYATAALVRPTKLRLAAQMLEEDPELEGVISVVRTPQPATRALVVREGRVTFQQDQMQFTRSQDLEETYFDAAQMYWLRTSAFLAQEASTMAFLRRQPLVLTEFETQDINTLEDWNLAELKYLFLTHNKNLI